MFVDDFIREHVQGNLRKQFVKEYFKYYPNESRYTGVWITKDVLFMLLEQAEKTR